MSRVERSSFADAGAWIALLMTMSLAPTPCPYSLPLPSTSGRSVEPSRETPANNPREREYERTSARNVTSALSLTWLVRMESALYFQKECFLAIKPLDEVGDGDAVTFPEARDTNFPGINCRPNLFVVRADETRRLLIEEGLTACPDVPVIS